MIVIAIDGPAASGKSTTARLVAQEMGFLHLDTGAMYRAVTLACMQAGIPPEESDRLAKLLATLEIQFQPEAEGGQSVRLNGSLVTEDIRRPDVTRQVSAYSALPGVRDSMVKLQRQIGQEHDVVCEGRDIGTQVFPDAQFKFYLVADLKVRAQRRFEEQLRKGLKPSLETIIAELEKRDREDTLREHSPLKQADDAVAVDTTTLTIPAQVEFALSKIQAGREKVDQTHRTKETWTSQ